MGLIALARKSRAAQTLPEIRRGMEAWAARAKLPLPAEIDAWLVPDRECDPVNL